MITKEGIEKHLKNDFDITVFDCIPSTNTYLKEIAKSGASEGTVVISRSQSNGKGRLGRSFFSPGGTGIYLSLLLRPDSSCDNALSITVCAAVAASEAIESVTGVSAKIKWVNDIYCNNKKVCGILTEGQIDPITPHLSFAVLGIGINVHPPKDGFPKELSDIAGSILPYSENEDIPNRLTAVFLDNFIEKYRHLGDKSFLDSYRHRSNLIDKRVRVLNSDTVGTVAGIDEDFRLLLRLDDNSILPLSSGEVSVREAP